MGSLPLRRKLKDFKLRAAWCSPPDSTECLARSFRRGRRKRQSGDGKGDGGGMVWSVDKEKKFGIIGEENLIIIQTGGVSGAGWGQPHNNKRGAAEAGDRRV